MATSCPAHWQAGHVWGAKAAATLAPPTPPPLGHPALEPPLHLPPVPSLPDVATGGRHVLQAAAPHLTLPLAPIRRSPFDAGPGAA